MLQYGYDSVELSRSQIKFLLDELMVNYSSKDNTSVLFTKLAKQLNVVGE